MPGAPAGRFRAAAGPVLGWLAAMAACWLLAGWGLSAHLDQQVGKHTQRLATGWRWDFDDPRSLVGRTPVGLPHEWRRDALLGRVDADGGYLSLAFEGERLDARRFDRLALEIAVDRPTALLLFHREALAGPVIGTAPIPLRRGRQTLTLALDRLPWTARRYRDGRPLGRAAPSAWGGRAGVVASLRLHPGTEPGTLFALRSLRILPRPGLAPAAPRRVAVLRERPERVLTERDRAWAQAPGRPWQPAPALALPPPLLPVTVAACCLLLAALRRRERSALALAAFIAAAVATLLAPPAGAGTTFAAAGLAGAALITLVAQLGQPAGAWRIHGAGWWIALALPLLALPAAAFAPASPEPGELAARLGRYLPWAVFQQWWLQTLLVPTLGGHQRPWALAGASALFAWLHFPNLSLMWLSGLFAGLTTLHFRRYRALLPLALGHAITGTLALVLLPRSWLWNGTVGLRFFGVG